MSRGPGRCQRRVIELLENAPGRQLSRAVLEEVLVAAEGYDASNLLRSLRRLERAHLVSFRDERHKRDAIVCLPREVEPVSEGNLFKLLAKLGSRQ